MPNPSDIAEEIKSFLALGEARPKGVLADLAAAYAALCRQANARLRQCADYLRRGLRAEAVYHAEIEPNLLDAVAALDLARLEDWNAVCAASGLEVAPQLLLEVAREVNHAYTDLEPVKQLLTQIRLLALARAPMRPRLAALRALLRHDAVSPLLEQDVKSFEAARLREIEAEADEALRAEDGARLDELLRELTDQTWRHPGASAMASRAARHAQEIRARGAVRELEAIAADLHAAHSALDHEECAALLARWDEIVRSTGTVVPAELLEQSRPARDYVRQVEQRRQTQREHATACSRLRSALQEEHCDLADLQGRHDAACSFGIALPEDLEHDYGAKVDQIRLAQRRRRRVIFGAAALLLLALIAGAVLLVRAGIAGVEAERWHARIEALVTEAQAVEAARAWDNLMRQAPHLAGRARLQRLKQRLDKLLKDYGQWQQQFNSLEARIAEGYPDRLEAKYLEEAKRLAEKLTSKEQLAALEWQHKFDEVNHARQQKTDAAFGRALDGLTTEFGKADPNLDPARLKVVLAELEQKLLPVKFMPGVSPELQGQLKPLEARLKSLWDGIYAVERIASAEKQKRDEEKQQREQERQRLEAIQGRLVDLGNQAARAEALAKALKAFAKDFPDHPKAKPFVEAAGGLDDWIAIERAADLVRSWRGELLTSQVKCEQIPGRIEQIATFRKNNPGCPMDEPLGTYAAYLQKAQGPLTDENPWWSQLLKMTVDSEVMRLHCFKTDAKTTYYMRSGARMKTDMLGLSAPVVIEQTGGLKLKEVTIRLGKISGESLYQPPGPSAQCALAKAIVTKLGGLDKRVAWDTIGPDLAHLITQSGQVDPILRAQLLCLVIGWIREHGWAVAKQPGGEKAFAGLSQLKEADEVLTWMDPASDRANRYRDYLTTVLDGLPSFADLRDAVVKSREDLAHGLRSIRWRQGALLKEGDRWQVVPWASYDEGNTFWIAPSASSADRKALRKIGAAGKDGAVIDPAAVAGVPEGTMVFIRMEGR